MNTMKKIVCLYLLTAVVPYMEAAYHLVPQPLEHRVMSAREVYNKPPDSRIIQKYTKVWSRNNIILLKHTLGNSIAIIIP